ncbi:hypothetical protein B566_EDAN009412 [Ephemera danica]|nr:hypothetical protein B566_EDAN009412 [Ephemera danica]
MPPKKREKDNESTKSLRIDQMQADHELFLQAFEKPTQIYRYLKTRNQLSPIFLPRTLSYMRQRMSRNHKSRREFQINDLLSKVVAAKMKEPIPQAAMADYLTLTFLGFYDKSVELKQDPVKVETFVLKICHKKRKDVSSPTMQSSVGFGEVPINPSEDHPPPQASTVSISTDRFKRSNEPCAKRRRREETSKLYSGDLVVYDRHNRCLLLSGDYELSLMEVQQPVRGSPKKHSSWENATDVQIEGSNPFESFKTCPTLKFRLNWASEPSSGMVDRPRITQGSTPGDTASGSNKENATPEGTSVGPARRRSETTASNLQKAVAAATSQQMDLVSTSSQPQRMQIVYQFLYNNNSRQQTEACDDLHCPWCSIDCGSLYALLKHLKLCHARFCFTYVPIAHGARIDVSINECFDGSYSGNALDVVAQPPGLAFSRDGPCRRTSITNILVCRPKRLRPNLSEFLEPDDPDFDNQRCYMTGHNRLYHHTTTCLPVYPKEMETDSEGENDPPWLQKKTMMMIDEFTDVNEGEKELMKMWNLHIMKHGFVGDCQIPLACDLFLEAKGREILMKNLYRNFVLHMCSLFDFGLVSAVGVYTTLQKLQEIASADDVKPAATGTSNNEPKRILQEGWHAQRECWLATKKAANDTHAARFKTESSTGVSS